MDLIIVLFVQRLKFIQFRSLNTTETIIIIDLHTGKIKAKKSIALTSTI